MIPAKKLIGGAILFGCIVFACSPGTRKLIDNPVAWEWREQLVFLTGVCGMSLMVLSMIISVRFATINKLAGGLDQAYVVHKWAGIFSTVFVLLHWLIENVPHWLVELNVIPNPGELTDGTQFSGLEIALFQVGVTIAEVMFYVFMLLIAIALITRIPYRVFRVTHKIFPVVFLLLAYHAATAQQKEHWLSSPAGYLLVALLSIGSFAAVIGLLQLIGKSKKVTSVITSVVQHGDKIVDIQLRPTRPVRYRPGQFAFLQFPHSSEPHPFSVVSTGVDQDTLCFAVKALGDFTSQLSERIQEGQYVVVEGPYGEFQFEDDRERQVWIAGGIGITPFLAQLEHLSRCGGTRKPVDFWYCTRGALEDQFPKSLLEQCRDNNINFYHLNSKEDQYLTLDVIKTKLNDLDQVDIWFCGPQAMATCLKRELKVDGFSMKHFHRENFRMR